jgi:hypothetical protein
MGFEPMIRVLQTLGLPDRPKAGGESTVMTRTGCHPPHGNSGWRRLTYTHPGLRAWA